MPAIIHSQLTKRERAVLAQDECIVKEWLNQKMTERITTGNQSYALRFRQFEYLGEKEIQSNT